MRRQRLSETQITELFEPPTEQRELVRHYTLSEADMAAILRCRGDHNRLGYALMRCYLRFPGRALRAGERPLVPLLGLHCRPARHPAGLHRRIPCNGAEPTAARDQVPGAAGVASFRQACGCRVDGSIAHAGDRERPACVPGRTGDADVPQARHRRPVSPRRWSACAPICATVHGGKHIVG